MNAPNLPMRQPAVASPALARWLGSTNEITRLFLSAGGIPGLINMAGGLPAPETYPAAELAVLARRVLEDHPQETLGYGPVEGLPQLRDALAARFATPALRLGRENILVTTSGMQGLDLIGKILLDAAGLVAAQAPTYLGALDAWKPRYPTYRCLDLEDPGFDPQMAMEGAQFAYTVPNFSNPTGRLVGLSQRHGLVDAAHSTGTWLVEDDPYGALHYDASPLPSLIGLSALKGGGHGGYEGPVIYMGTLSKQVSPGLRIGWVVAAPPIIEALTKAKQGSDMCTSGLTQRLTLAAMEDGLVERCLPSIRSLYHARRDALCSAMDEHLRDWFDWQVPVGGMFVWAVARDPAFDTDRLMQTCLAAGVCVTPSSVFDPAGTNRRAIRINFTLNPPDRLAEGVRRLAGAVAQLSLRKDRP